MQASFSEQEYAAKKKQTRRDRFYLKLKQSPRGHRSQPLLHRTTPAVADAGDRPLAWSACSVCTLPNNALACLTKE